MRKDRLISPLDSYIPKSENLSLTFNAANRGDKKRCRAKTPSTQRKTLCHFDQREKSFLDLSHSLGMTALARHLGALCAFARDTCFPTSSSSQNFKYLWLGFSSYQSTPLLFAGRIRRLHFQSGKFH